MRAVLIWTLAVVLVGLTGAVMTGSERADGTVTVLAASSLRPAIDDPSAPDRCEVVFGSSGVLARSITRGREFGVFLSADWRYADRVAKHLSLAREPTLIGRAEIVLLLDRGAGDDETGTVSIAIPNPAVAPVGSIGDERLHELVGSAVRVVHAPSAADAARLLRDARVDGAVLTQGLAQAALGDRASEFDSIQTGFAVQYWAVCSPDLDADECVRVVAALDARIGP